MNVFCAVDKKKFKLRFQIKVGRAFLGHTLVDQAKKLTGGVGRKFVIQRQDKGYFYARRMSAVCYKFHSGFRSSALRGYEHSVCQEP